MSVLKIGDSDGLFYEWDKPTAADGKTFVFINAITGNSSMWQNTVGPNLREAGHGTLVYNFRGQPNSPYSPGLELTEQVIVDDLVHLLESLSPKNPVLVGLSIGSLYAVKALLKGVHADGLIMLNMLRRIDTRIQWMNDIIPRLLAFGGTNLVRDAFTHLITGPAFTEKSHSIIFGEAPDYKPLAPDSDLMNLVTHMGKADWNVPYEQINVPTLVISGLQDRVFYDADVFEELYARIPDAQRLDMADVGHMIPAENPDGLLAAMLEFVA